MADWFTQNAPNAESAGPSPVLRMGISGAGADERPTTPKPQKDWFAQNSPAVKPPTSGMEPVGAMDYLTTPESVNAPSPGGFGRNAVRSAGRLASGLVDAVTPEAVGGHLRQTAEAIGSIPVGAYEKLGGPVPAGWDDAPGGGKVSAKMLDSMLGHFKERYGSIEGAKKALYEDPVGVAADVSAVTGLAGAAVPGAAGRALETASRVTDPIKAATRAVTAPARAFGVPERMYQSALKPGKAIGPRQIGATNKILHTGLEQKIPVTEGGLTSLRDRVGELDASVQAPIEEGAAAGKAVDPYDVARSMQGTRKTFANQVNPQSDLDALERSRQEFLTQQGERPGVPGTPPTPAGPPQATGLFDQHGNPIYRPGAAGKPGTPPIAPTPAAPIPADVAQDLKRGTYRQLKNKSYGELKGADIEAQKALASGLRQGLIKLFPEIEDKLALEGDLLDLAKPLENRLRVAGNHDLMGIGTPIAGTLGAAAGGAKAGMVATVGKAILDNPWFKSRAAIMLYNAGRANGLSLPTAIQRVNAWSAKPPQTKPAVRPMPPEPRAGKSPQDIENAVTAAARENGVDEHLARAVAKNESAFQPHAVSAAGAQGVMQLMPGTAADMGATDAFDPNDNIAAGVKYLKQLQDRYGNDWSKVASAYHAGPGNVDKGRIGPETKKYVERVIRDRERFAAQPQFAKGGIVTPKKKSPFRRSKRGILYGPRSMMPPEPAVVQKSMPPEPRKPAPNHPWRNAPRFGKI